MSAIRLLWHKHRIIFLVFLGACAVTLFFLGRLAMFTIYWADPAHRNQVPEPWMTVGYVAHSWGIEPKTLAEHLAIELGTRQTLAQLARSRGIPVSTILDTVNTLLADRPIK